MAPSKLSALQTVIQEVRKNLAFMQQEMTIVKHVLAHLSKGKNSPWKDLDEDRRCWSCNSI